jgi:putative aldouronate transport system permease protein
MTASTETRATGRTAEPPAGRQLPTGHRKGRVKTPKPSVRLGIRMRRNWQLYVMLALPLIWLAVFAYWPMYGVVIAFNGSWSRTSSGT